MASHTATGEWKSFEVRMRQRRAERLLLRAEVATEAGFLDEADGALAEARRLSADPADAARVERLIAAARAGNAAHRVSTRTRIIYIGSGVAALLLLSTFAGAFWAYRTGGTSQRDTSSTAGSAPARQTSETPAAGPAVRVVTAAVTPRVITTDPIAPTPSDSETSPGPRSAEDTPVPMPVLQPRPEPAPVATPPATTVATIENRHDTAPPPRDARLDTSGNSPAPIADLAVAPSTPAPAPVMNNDAVLVRGVLEQYASAYTRLDAQAARAAWPSVDVAALSRAFEGLASQQVSLGNCSVDVNGATARAACSGSTTWQPKVGGGVRTDPRTWTFDLTRAGDGWQIVSARVQNR